MQRIIQRHRGPREAGVSLLEVLMAISLLGISFATIFSGLSAALRTTDRLDAFRSGQRFCRKKAQRALLGPLLRRPGQVRSGISPSGIGWQARTELVDERPLSGSQKPAQLVRITLEVSWRTRSGRQSLSLETLKLCIPELATQPVRAGFRSQESGVRSQTTHPGERAGVGMRSG